MNRNKYDDRTKKLRHQEKMRLQLAAQAERARFVAKHNGEKPKLYIATGFSDLDPLTNVAFTWDLWLKFPFKVLKTSEQMNQFKERVQTAFQEIFLA